MSSFNEKLNRALQRLPINPGAETPKATQEEKKKSITEEKEDYYDKKMLRLHRERTQKMLEESGVQAVIEGARESGYDIQVSAEPDILFS